MWPNELVNRIGNYKLVIAILTSAQDQIDFESSSTGNQVERELG